MELTLLNNILNKTKIRSYKKSSLDSLPNKRDKLGRILVLKMKADALRDVIIKFAPLHYLKKKKLDSN